MDWNGQNNNHANGNGNGDAPFGGTNPYQQNFGVGGFGEMGGVDGGHYDGGGPTQTGQPAGPGGVPLAVSVSAGGAGPLHQVNGLGGAVTSRRAMNESNRAVSRASGGSNEGPGNRPQILLLGLKGSGKTSLRKTVFQRMPPNETLYLEPTQNVVRTDVWHSSFVNFSMYDFPGGTELTDGAAESEELLKAAKSLVFVLDAQDEYRDALDSLNRTVFKAATTNPDMTIQVFIHKVDGLSDDHKIEVQRDIHSHVIEALHDQHMDHVQVSFFLTSIYDHSVFEAFSKVVQRLVPRLQATLEKLLDTLVASCRMEKAFLFDVVSKIYVATDSAPVDMQTYELCSDMIDVSLDISGIYGPKEDLVIPYDDQMASHIRLASGTVLYLRGVSRYVAIVCQLRDESSSKHGLVLYNFSVFRDAIQQLFDLQVSWSH